MTCLPETIDGEIELTGDTYPPSSSTVTTGDLGGEASNWYVAESPHYRVYRSFLSFDTSTLDDISAIVSVTLHIRASTWGAAASNLIEVYSGDWGSSLSGADWGCGVLNGTYLTVIDAPDDPAWVEVSIPTSVIDKAGRTQFELANINEGSTPPPSSVGLVYLAEASVNEVAPYLEVEVSEWMIVGTKHSIAGGGLRALLLDRDGNDVAKRSGGDWTGDFSLTWDWKVTYYTENTGPSWSFGAISENITETTSAGLAAMDGVVFKLYYIEENHTYQVAGYKVVDNAWTSWLSSWIPKGALMDNWWSFSVERARASESEFRYKLAFWQKDTESYEDPNASATVTDSFVFSTAFVASFNANTSNPVHFIGGYIDNVVLTLEELWVSEVSTDLEGQAVEVLVRYSNDSAIAPGATVQYAGLTAYADSEGWASFSLSSVAAAAYGSEAVPVNDSLYGFGEGAARQVLLEKSTVAPFKILAGGTISSETWNDVERHLDFTTNASSAAVVVGDYGTPLRVEVNGETFTGWSYDSTLKVVSITLSSPSAVRLVWDTEDGGGGGGGGGGGIWDGDDGGSIIPPLPPEARDITNIGILVIVVVVVAVFISGREMTARGKWKKKRRKNSGKWEKIKGLE